MAAVLDVNHALFVDARLYVVIFCGHCGKGGHHVDACDRPGRLLNSQNLGGNGVSHLTEEAVFQRIELVLRPQDHILQFLQFIRCIPLGISQRLLADKVVRNHPFKGIRHFEVISKHLVVFDLQILDSCFITLSGLQLCKPRLSFRLRMAQLVRLLVVAFFYDSPVS